MFINTSIHCCPLFLTTKNKDWVWDGLNIIRYGCHKNGVLYKPRSKGKVYYCQKCDFDLWIEWVEEYSGYIDIDDLKTFQKPELSEIHDHPFVVRPGSIIPKKLRENCIGKFSNIGCMSNFSSEWRYLVWMECKDFICEKWYLKKENLIIEISDLHQHQLYLYKDDKENLNIWSTKKIGCLKKSNKETHNQRMFYRCKEWSFYTWVNCTKTNNS